jgi:hypothetical protein
MTERIIILKLEMDIRGEKVNFEFTGNTCPGLSREEENEYVKSQRKIIDLTVKSLGRVFGDDHEVSTKMSLLPIEIH